MHNQHIDSTVWNDFKFRDDDIIISTYAKSGTTWMQQIVSQMLFDGDTERDTQALSPWVDFRVPPKEVKLPALEEQTNRRFVKTHLPVEALVYSPKAKYIYIGRDGRDVLWSLYNHHLNGNEIMYDALNKTPGLVGPPLEPPPDDIRVYWRDWLDRDGFPYWSLWENVRSWWAIRHLPISCWSTSTSSRSTCPRRCAESPRFWRSRSTRASGTRSSSTAPSTG
ncbi:MAG: sulfotransferase domain-containing protein [Paludibaculum sp.]